MDNRIFRIYTLTPAYTVWRNISHSFGACSVKFVTWITEYVEYIYITPSYTVLIGCVAEHIIQFWRMQRKVVQWKTEYSEYMYTLHPRILIGGVAEHIIQFWRMQRKVRHMDNRIFRIYTVTPSYTHRRCGGTYHTVLENAA